MAEYVIGQEVMSPLGKGTVIGFETYVRVPKQVIIDTRGARGYEGDRFEYVSRISEVDIDTSGRIIVKLNDPKKWLAAEITPHPHMYRHEVKPINA